MFSTVEGITTDDSEEHELKAASAIFITFNCPSIIRSDDLPVRCGICYGRRSCLSRTIAI